MVSSDEITICFTYLGIGETRVFVGVDVEQVPLYLVSTSHRAEPLLSACSFPDTSFRPVPIPSAELHSASSKVLSYADTPILCTTNLPFLGRKSWSYRPCVGTSSIFGVGAIVDR
jgi:hypothetical protein